jgi:hypothetical protein
MQYPKRKNQSNDNQQGQDAQADAQYFNSSELIGIG